MPHYFKSKVSSKSMDKREKDDHVSINKQTENTKHPNKQTQTKTKTKKKKKKMNKNTIKHTKLKDLSLFYQGKELK